MAATFGATAEEELLDAAAQSILRELQHDPLLPRGLAEGNTDPHANAAEELDASDADGFQGGQDYSPLAAAPATLPPTAAPTAHPTLRGQVKMLRGIFWYDRNGNGARDSNVNAEGMGSDVEYSHGIGGVNVQLIECDEASGRAYVPTEGEDIATRATAISQGFDSRMIPQVIRADDQNGKYNLFINGLERWYYVQVEAPDGYLFTSGICNDDVDGWECHYNAGPAQARRNTAKEDPDSSMGIRSGRSTSCVYIDKMGNVERPLNFGILRESDTQEVNANVALVLAFDSEKIPTPGQRRLADVLRDARVLDVVDDGEVLTTRYLLGRRDRDAIGTVAAEVLAATLDSRLAENDVVLDKVDPREVIVTNARPSDGDTSTAPVSQLAVAMKIKGHYSPPPSIDFDQIVQTSINRDTSVIRRGLRDYNGKCRDQRAKVNEQGAREEDFKAVVSSRGARRRGGARGTDSLDDAFSTACMEGALVPTYFETELGEVRALVESEDGLEGALLGLRRVADGSAGGRLDDWAVGPVAGIAGLIALLAGALVYRRALGARRADAYSDLRKTKNVDDSEARRFGEAGGAADDGSVDSAFYSDDELDVEVPEETEKERKMRRKRREKGRMQQRGDKSSSSSRAKGSRKKISLSESKNPRREVPKLATSQGSGDTDSLGKSSKDSEEIVNKSGRSRKSLNDSEEVVDKSSRRRDRKRSAKDRSENKPKSKGKHDRKSSDRRRERRGRNRRSGGDNTRLGEEANHLEI